MRKIPLSTYLATNSPQNARKLLAAWDVRIGAGTTEELADKLNKLFNQQGQGVMVDMLNLHPDKDAIIAIHEKYASREIPPPADTEKKAGACGCSSCDGAPCASCAEKNKSGFVRDMDVYGFDGAPAATNNEGKYPLLLFGGIAVLFGWMISKNN